MLNAQQQAFIRGNGIAGGISFAIYHNPRGVYDFIQSHYPNEFGIWTKGTESDPASMKRMCEFLESKAAMSANAAAFTQALLQSVPYNPNANNWTKH